MPLVWVISLSVTGYFLKSVFFYLHEILLLMLNEKNNIRLINETFDYKYFPVFLSFSLPNNWGSKN